MKTVMVGAGWIAGQHAKAAAELGIGIAGVLDVNKENAKKLADMFGTKPIDSLDEVLGEVDMIHLLTPPSKRLEYARQAMQAGVHVLAEKPISVSVEDAQAMIALAKENNVNFMIGFNNRFRAGYKMLQDAVASGELGDVVNIFSHRLGAGTGFAGGSLSANWRTDPALVCGMSIESMSHDIDMLLHLVDGVKSVSANIYGSIASLPEFDNNSNVSFKLNNGGVGLIHASWSSHLGYCSRGVIGTKGSAAVRGEDLFDFADFIIKTEKMPHTQITKFVGNDNDVFRTYVEVNRSFAESVKNKTKPVITGEDGLNALIFSRAIVESEKTGKAVEVNL